MCKLCNTLNALGECTTSQLSAKALAEIIRDTALTASAEIVAVLMREPDLHHPCLWNSESAVSMAVMSP